jgi:hypothetical protein
MISNRMPPHKKAAKRLVVNCGRLKTSDHTSSHSTSIQMSSADVLATTAGLGESGVHESYEDEADDCGDEDN